MLRNFLAACSDVLAKPLWIAGASDANGSPHESGKV